MVLALTPPHADLTFMTPLSQERADQLVRFVANDLQGTVLDIGCGWAELLLRVAAAAPAADGLGIDMDEAAIEHGQTLAQRRGLDDRVTLLAGDAKELAPRHAEAVICIGASQVWGPPVEDNQPLDYASALAALRSTVSRGAHVVYGEGIWSRPPTRRAAAPLSGRLDELVSLGELADLTVAQGFMPIAVHEASLDEWDEFESGFNARYASWLATHDPDDPDAGEVRALAARQRAAYFDGYRGVLGMAYFALLAV
jgi:SAM-dependent methyltransferase